MRTTNKAIECVPSARFIIPLDKTPDPESSLRLDEVEQMQAYADVGVEELIVQWVSLDDIEGLEVMAEQVLPRFAIQGLL
jgi:hypothetical protein